MGRTCQVCGKRSVKYPNLSLHRFPTDIPRRNVSCVLLDINLQETRLPKQPVICSEHFRPGDIIMKDSFKCLKPGVDPIAVHSFLSESDSEQSLERFTMEDISFDSPLNFPDDSPAVVTPSKLINTDGEHFEDSDEDIDPEEKAMEEFLERERQATELEIDRTTAQFMTRITMSNTMMMFRKIVDHPYLVHMPMDPSKEKKELLINDDLIATSGKMMVLDVMLRKLKQQGHKVLIFSTLTMTLDLIEDYMIYKNLQYRRLDGSYHLDERAANISDFNNDPDVLAFLVSTRAGGLGLNLTGADTVIFFDRDWNPQADIQAQDRCHRIGQTRPVMVYTLVTKNTIDEKVINTGTFKRLLEKIVIKDGKFKTLNQEDKSKVGNLLNELKDMLEKGDTASTNYMFCNDAELDKLLDRSELYAEMKALSKQNQQNNKKNRE